MEVEADTRRKLQFDDVASAPREVATTTTCFNDSEIALEELKKHEMYHEVVCRDTAGPMTQSNTAETELGHVKEHFSKLKFNFVELETKQAFMERVVRSGTQPLPSAAQVKELEGRVSEEKQGVKVAKLDNAKLQAQVVGLCSEVGAHQQTVTAAADELNKLLTQYTDASQELSALEACGGTVPDMEWAGTPVTLANGGEILQEQEGWLAKLTGERDSLEVSVKELRTAVQHDAAHLKGLQADLATTREAINSFCNTQEDVDRKLRELQGVAENLVTQLGAVLGISVPSVSANMMEVVYTTYPTPADGAECVARRHSLSVHVDPDTLALQGGALYPNDVSIEEEVSEAMANNSIPQLVQAVWARLASL